MSYHDVEYALETDDEYDQYLDDFFGQDFGFDGRAITAHDHNDAIWDDHDHFDHWPDDHTHADLHHHHRTSHDHSHNDYLPDTHSHNDKEPDYHVHDEQDDQSHSGYTDDVDEQGREVFAWGYDPYVTVNNDLWKLIE